jgi:tRNA pseudouridine55 synthase
MALAGLLNLSKPGGITSRRVVDQVQRLVRPTKVGHAGTLDPLATGVLVVCVGAASRLIEYVQQMPKQYTGTFLLGRRSTTEDIEGDVELLESPPMPTREEIAEAAAAFIGKIQQRPPALSALKLQGQRAYDLARAGKQVDLAPRPVVIHRIEVLTYDYPELRLHIECGSGTYIRSLGRDLAERLDTAAVMSALMRTAIGGFRLADAVDANTLNRDNLVNHLLPMLRAVESLPTVRLSSDEAARIGHGLSIERPDAPAGPELAAINGAGELIAILARRPDGRYGPERNLAAGPDRT